MSACRLAYEIQSKQPVKHILDAVHRINFEQRWFMWTPEKYVLPTLENALKKFKMGDQEWMGQVIILYWNKQTSIYDGQHRITTLVLTLVGIAYLTEDARLRETILGKVGKIFYEYDTDSLDEEGKNILERIGGERLSNIRSDWEFDLSMLNNIVQTGKVLENSKSKIGGAFSAIHQFLMEKLDEDQRRAFYKFLCNEMFFDVMTITEWELVPDFFNKVNNIKMELPLWLAARTQIQGNMGVSYETPMREIVMAVLESSKCKVLDENHILQVSISIFHKKWINATDVLNPQNYKFSKENFKDWERIVFGIIKIIQQIAENMTLSRLLNEFTTGHEIKSTLVLPLLYTWSKTNDFDITPYFERVVKIVIAGSLHVLTHVLTPHNNKFKMTLNSKRYQTKIIGEKGLVVRTLENKVPESTRFFELKELFCTVDGQFTKDDFASKWKDRFPTFSRKQQSWCKAVLQLLWYINDSHEMLPDFTKADLEHILSQSHRDQYPELVDRIGNMTLLSAKNGHDLRGNRSLGKLGVSEKITMYAKSNIRRTRDLARDLASVNDFGLKDITRIEEQIIQSLFDFIQREIYTI